MPAHDEDIEEHYDWEDDLDLIGGEISHSEKESHSEKKQKKSKETEKKVKREEPRPKKEEPKEVKKESQEDSGDLFSDSVSDSEFLDKEPRKSSFGLWVAGIIIFLIFGGATWYVLAPEQIAAKNAGVINGVPVTEDQLATQYEIFFLFSGLPEGYRDTMGKEEYLDQILTNEVLLISAAEAQGIEIMDSELQQEYQNFLKGNGLTERVLEQQLAEKKLELGDIKQFIRNRMLMAGFLDKNVFSGVTAAEEELTQYFQQNVPAKQERVKASHILVTTKEEAEQVVRKLKAGEDFAELARNLSIDPSAKANNGSLGYFGKGVMVQEFESAAFSLDVGEISDPVQTQFGFHIIKVEDRKDEITLDDVRSEVEANVVRGKQEQALQGFLEQMRERADIKIEEESKDGSSASDQKSGQKSEFTPTGQAACTEDGKPVIRMFSASRDPQSWSREAFNSLAIQYPDAVVYSWELDTGDNLVTPEEEHSVPQSEVDLFIKYSPKSQVPAFVFSCQYVRIGNAFSERSEQAELQEFKMMMERVL
ncbi:MAG TPA: peptidylprolyl isomerase [Candidatus Nanoarchaeia archaeon]|nr:peptidylprolyl isomerase [Candidatus Nanoarchaeia archaeon]